MPEQQDRPEDPSRRSFRVFLLFFLLLLPIESLSFAAEAPRTLIIVDDKDYPPFAFLDAKGAACGITIDIWKLWSRKTGIPVRFELMEWDAALAAVREGRADAVGGLFRTAAREADFDFSRAILKIPTGIFFHRQIAGIKGLDDLDGFQVGVIKGDFGEELLRTGHPHIELRSFSGAGELVRAAVAGEIKVFVADEPVALFYLAQQPGGDQFQETTAVAKLNPQCTAVKKGNAELLATIQSGFARISEAEIKQIVADWAGRSTVGRLPWREIGLGLLAVLLLVAAVLAWNFLLHRKVAEATQNLREREETFRALTENSLDVIMRFDRQGRHLYVNPIAEKQTGIPVQNFIGKTHAELGFAPELCAVWEKAIRETVEFKAVRRIEFQLPRGAWIDWLLMPEFDAHGEVKAVITAARDITERKLAEEALRASEQKYRQHFASVNDVIYSFDANGVILDVSPSIERFLGFQPEELIGRPFAELNLLTPESLEKAVVYVARVFAGERIDGVEYEFVHRDGSRRFGEVSGSPIIVDGRVTATVAVARDVTERERVEQALRDSENLFRNLFEQHVAIKLVIDPETGNIFDANQAAANFYGWPREQLERMNIRDINTLSPEQVAREMEKAKNLERVCFDFRHRRADGSIRDVEVYSSKIEIRGKVFLHSIIHDITERKQIEEALRESEEKYRSLVETTAEWIWEMDLTGRHTYSNPGISTILGYRLDEFLGRDAFDIIHPENHREIEAAWPRLIAEKKGWRGWIVRFRHRDGSYRYLESNANPILNAAGELVGFRGSDRDITERKQSEEALRRTQFAMDRARDSILWIDDDGRIIYANDSACSSMGFTRDELLAMKVFDIDPDFPQSQWEQFKQMLRRQGHHTFESRHRTKDGRYFPVEVSTNSFQFGDRFIACAFDRDISERKRAEREKDELAAQLQQAMKMEAVGRLAGGVAHDFNNLLTGITGNVELALLDLAPGDPLAVPIAEIGKAADSAAALTRQLLAFSRKQLIEPKVLDLNQLIANLHKMLTRLIGEDIELTTVAGGDLGPVRIDPGQFEQILVNLAVNARDAMPAGGKLIIETANVELDEEYCQRHAYANPGNHVLLAVSDTGHGMNEEVKKHLFEPFFTTKPLGHGTGLGLATIYGAVKQANGHIETYSEEGRGTTFKIYLPRVTERAGEKIARGDAEAMRGGNEVVLLVEDDDLVRGLALKVLQRLGYRILSAADGQQALEIAGQHPERIDLLLTDVIMPGMNGQQLAERLTQIHPESKVLFTSGYTEDAIAHHGVIDAGLHFIGKPYTPQNLARKIREVLESD
ncbi:MAG: PAS domain S-box protein [Myxococcales bacterium]|nr:PAS domain S-box protein [Myxococcales bacterium]